MQNFEMKDRILSTNETFLNNLEVFGPFYSDSPETLARFEGNKEAAKLIQSMVSKGYAYYIGWMKKFFIEEAAFNLDLANKAYKIDKIRYERLFGKYQAYTSAAGQMIRERW